MLFNIIAIIVGIPLAIIIFAIIFAEIGDTFSNLRYRHDLLKSAKKVIAEAKLWKDDVEYYLNVIKNNGPLTFRYKNSIQVYDYERMYYFLDRINTYLANYDIYVKYVNKNRINGLHTPFFHSEYNLHAEKPDECISNYAILVHEKEEIDFLRLLHEFRKKNT